MTFTDDDLKRLKEQTKDDRYLDSIGLPALLVRLEESEKLNDAFINGFQDAVEFRLKTWRKAAGK